MPESEHDERHTARGGFSSYSLRTQLLLAVNIPLIVLFAVFLIQDFRGEMAERVNEKRIALEEEAKTMVPAILQMHTDGQHLVQNYVDMVCSQMQEAHSPRHHIVVELAGEVLQAESHHRSSPEMFELLQLAADSPSSTANLGAHEIIVGKAVYDDLIVYVSEGMAELRKSVWNDLVRRAAAFLMGAVIAGGILNVVLLRLVATPLGRLVNAVREIASGNLGVQAGRASSAELRFLYSEVNAMSQSLADADAYRALQMAKAREIQQHVVPLGRQVAGLAMSSVFEPADEVGGDYYDVITLPGDKVIVCVADVTGHGVSAAMSTMLLRALLHMGTETHTAMVDIMKFVNNRFVDATLPGDFATLILVQIDLRARRLQYASAGHETGVLLSPSGEHRALDSTGLILGIEKDAAFTSHQFNYEPGDRILLVTDGVTEAAQPGGEMFGRERQVELLKESTQDSVDEVTRKLNHELVLFRENEPSHDDVTIVLIEATRESEATNSES